jgi:hypothetical protein
MCGHTYAYWGHRRREKGGDDRQWCNGQIGVSPPRILVSHTSGSLNRWMKATLGTGGGSPGSSTVRCMALGSGWKYGENSPKPHKRQDWAETRFFSGNTMQTCNVTSIETLMQHKTRKSADWQKLDFLMVFAFFSEKCCQHMSPFTRYTRGSPPRYVTASC